MGKEIDAADSKGMQTAQNKAALGNQSRYRKAAIFLRLDGWFNRLVLGMQIAHRGVWLGLLDSAALQRVTELKYSSWELYLSREHNESGLTSWEEEVLKRYYANCRSLLVASAGAGREVVSLSQRGYEVDAFDCVKPLVANGKQLLDEMKISARLVDALPDKVPNDMGTYDGLIIGWSGYMHIIGRERRIDFLQQLRNHVRADAPLLLSFFTRPATSKFFTNIERVGNRMRRWRGSQERLELGDNLHGTFDHYFNKAEIESELVEAGYELVFYSTTPYGHAVGRAI